MFNEKIKNVKALIESKTQNINNKKKIENLIVFTVLLIITIIAINVILGDNKKPETNNSQNNVYKQLAEQTENYNNISDNSSYNLEKNLETILSKISGVGQVKVMITYSRNK